MQLLDTGILLRILGLALDDILLNTDIKLVNRGGLAETFVGTELVKAQPVDAPAQHYCWHREAKDSDAEVDFVIQTEGAIMPIEVKSGVSGSMHSMRIFLKEKQLPKGVRTSLENFSAYQEIEVIPLYAIGKLMRQQGNAAYLSKLAESDEQLAQGKVVVKSMADLEAMENG